jgi:hypothetical protein
MNAPAGVGSGPLRRVAGPILLLAAVAWTAAIHHGLGPRPDLNAQWYSPTGFLTRALLASPFESLLAERWKGFLVFWTPALLLAVACWVTTRSALIRTAAAAAALAAAIFLLYGLGSEMSKVAWSLFHWRASGTMLAIAGVVAAAFASPWLAASWLRLPWSLRIATFLPVALGVVAIERGVTGTNPRLPFAISPWPAVQVFGLEVVGTIVASLLAGAALGLAGLAALRGGRRLAGAAAIALGLALPAAWLALGGQGFLPFHAGRRGFVVATALCGLALAAAALPRLEPGRLARRARILGTAALLLGLPLLIGQAWARVDYARNRDVEARRVIDALASYYEREQIYPETLDSLVESRDLASVPKPRIGFGFLGDGTSFTYQAFGTSYLLEFPAPRWVQCAYNPPYDDEELEEDADLARADPASAELESEDMGGAWSCPSSPPELW